VGAAFGQEFNFYKGENIFGETLYGLEDEHGLKVTELKWRGYYKYGTMQFGNSVAMVSEDGDNYFYINMLGERVSVFSFQESFMIEDTYMKYEGDLKVAYDFGYATSGESDLEYYLNEDCACDPRPYYPCPARFPMDTSNATEATKQVQKMQFLLEFYTLDSALQTCNQLIERSPQEAQYYFYKAWLLDRAYPIAHYRFGRMGYDDEYPMYIWDELIRLRDKDLLEEDEKLQMYIAQYDAIQTEIKNLENRKSWGKRNKADASKYILDYDDYIGIYAHADHFNWNDEDNYSHRKTSLYQALDALTEVLALEQDREIILITKAWQNRMIYYFEWTSSHIGNGVIPYESDYKDNEWELRKSPDLYEVLKQEKFGPIARINAATRNGQLGLGLGVSLGAITRINKVWTTESSVGLGYNHYFMNDVYGEYYFDLTIGPTGWIEMRLAPSLLTNYADTLGIGFLPSIGIRIWDIYLSYGYNLARKSKFESIRGHSFGLSYAFGFMNTRVFNKKRDGYLL
jgi:hypothetical protein